MQEEKILGYEEVKHYNPKKEMFLLELVLFSYLKEICFLITLLMYLLLILENRNSRNWGVFWRTEEECKCQKPRGFTYY